MESEVRTLVQQGIDQLLEGFVVAVEVVDLLDRAIAEDVTEAEALVHMRQQPAHLFGAGFAATGGQHRRGDAFLQVFPDILRREEGGHGAVRPVLV